MAYYKLFSEKEVLDAINEDTAQWIVENPNNFSLYSGKREIAYGILSNDNGTVFHLKDKPIFHDFPNFITVEMEEITEDEYNFILDSIKINNIIEIEKKEDNILEQEKPLTAFEKLQKQVNELIQNNYTEPIDNTIEGIKKQKIKEMSSACNAAIISGVDVPMDDGKTYHFSLTVEDQLNLISLQASLTEDQEKVPYHADGENYRYFSKAEFNRLIIAGAKWKLYHQSYFNNLRTWINQMDNIEDINSIKYGDLIPQNFYTDVMKEIVKN